LEDCDLWVCTRLHSITSQKMVLTVIVMTTSHLTFLVCVKTYRDNDGAKV